LPRNAALIPKKKIAKENAQPSALASNPLFVNVAPIGALNNDQQYTVPIPQCNNNAGMAARVHLLLKFFIIIPSFVNSPLLIIDLLFLIVNCKTIFFVFIFIFFFIEKKRASESPRLP
jgi:uncharacterized membrane protein